jgi:hypothetical protein
VFRHAAPREAVEFAIGTGDIGAQESGPPELDEVLYTSPALALGEQDQLAVAAGEYLVRVQDAATGRPEQFAAVSGSPDQVSVLALVSDDRQQEPRTFTLITTYEVATTKCAAPAPSPTPSPTTAPVPRSVPTGALPQGDPFPGR